MSEPLISIIITCYNYGQFVRQAIDSVLCQTYRNIELIVINDGSTDGSADVIGSFVSQYPKIVYYEQPNLGANTARNVGVGLATGSFLFFLDADNWLDAEHIARLYETAVTTLSDVVYCDLKHFGDDNDMLVMPEFSLEILKTTNFIDTSSLVSRSALGDSRFDEAMNGMVTQDWDFFLGLALKGLSVTKAKGVSLNYRVHTGQHGFKAFRDSLTRPLEAREYVTAKYAEMYPDQFDYVTRFFSSKVWEAHVGIVLASEGRQQVEELKKDVSKRDSEITRLNEQINGTHSQLNDASIELEKTKQALLALVNSRTYRLARWIGTPLRATKSVTTRSRRIADA